nr:splicing regulator SDE2 [Nothobranchius furzeri]
MEVFVCTPTLWRSTCVFPHGSVVRDAVNRFVPQQDFYVTTNGRLAHLDDPLQNGAIYHLEPRLCGGKGGFGSMLRALGAQIEKTTNREACRDLSGRRLRDVNHEKEMAEWLKKQAEREAEKEQRRLERLQRKLAEPKHQFTDPEYQRQCHDLSERLEDSVLKGLQVSSSSQVKVSDDSTPKRRSTNLSKQPQKKKKKTVAGLWSGLDGLEEFSSSEDGDDDDDGFPCTSSLGDREGAVTMTTSIKKAEPEVCSSSSDRSSASVELEPGPPGEQRPEDQRPGPSGEQRPGPSGEQRPGPSGEQRPEDQRPGPSGEQRPEDQRPGPSGEQRPEDQRPGPSGEQRPGPSGEQRPGPSGEQRPGPSGEQRPEDQRPGPSGEQRPEDQRPGPSGEQRPEDQRPGPSGDQRPPETSESRCLSHKLDLSSVTSVQQLESLGLDVLKEELSSRGLKCGGTLPERAARLFSIRGLSPSQINPVLLAKPAKAKPK